MRLALAALVVIACSSSGEETAGGGRDAGIDAASEGAASGGSAGLPGGTGGVSGTPELGGNAGLGGYQAEAGIDAAPDVGPDVTADAADAGPDAETGSACPEPCVSTNLLWSSPSTAQPSGHHKAYAVCPAGTTLDVGFQEPYCQGDCAFGYAQFNIPKQLWQCGAANPGPSTCEIFFRCDAPSWCPATSSACP